MEILALLAFGGLILWLVSRSAGNRRLAAEEERRRDLAVFEWDRSDEHFTNRSLFNFAVMRCQHTAGIDDYGANKRSTLTYLLRRHDGHWETQLTASDWREEMDRLTEDREELKRKVDKLVGAQMSLESVEATIAKLESGPVWEPIADEIAAPLETAYQRYVRQG